MPTPPREDADIETSSEGYARRFAGPVGAFFLEVQTRLTLAALAAQPGASILDVGGGHGQTLGPLAEAGFAVTVFGSDAACAARVQPWIDAGHASFASGDLLELPFEAASFDVAVSYRLLPHVERWERLVAELCRVARHAVVVDYPTLRSVNAVADLLFGLKRRIEGNTRPFRVFRDGELYGEFARHGFRVGERRPEFFWPMALHRALGRVGTSRTLERVATALGLTRAFGSPVVLKVTRG